LAFDEDFEKPEFVTFIKGLEKYKDSNGNPLYTQSFRLPKDLDDKWAKFSQKKTEKALKLIFKDNLIEWKEKFNKDCTCITVGHACPPSVIELINSGGLTAIKPDIQLEKVSSIQQNDLNPKKISVNFHQEARKSSKKTNISTLLIQAVTKLTEFGFHFTNANNESPKASPKVVEKVTTNSGKPVLPDRSQVEGPLKVKYQSENGAGEQGTSNFKDNISKKGSNLGFQPNLEAIEEEDEGESSLDLKDIAQILHQKKGQTEMPQNTNDKPDQTSINNQKDDTNKEDLTKKVDIPGINASKEDIKEQNAQKSPKLKKTEDPKEQQPLGNQKDILEEKSLEKDGQESENPSSKDNSDNSISELDFDARTNKNKNKNKNKSKGQSEKEEDKGGIDSSTIFLIIVVVLAVLILLGVFYKKMRS
jgi:hypothetical protein